MEHIRQIIREELQTLMEGGLQDTPMFNDPKVALEYAMEWQGKAVKMNKFYWQVSNIMGAMNMTPEEKLHAINELLPNYGWV